MTMADGRAIAPMAASIRALADRMLVDERALVKIPEFMPPKCLRPSSGAPS